MWSNFFAAGGWGMYPISLFGFLLLAASVLYALRPEPRMARVARTMGLVTLGAGLLGTAIGVCMSAHYIPEVEKDRQLQVLALGVEESLHDVVLALMIVIVAGLVLAVGHMRRTAPASA